MWFFFGTIVQYKEKSNIKNYYNISLLVCFAFFYMNVYRFNFSFSYSLLGRKGGSGGGQKNTVWEWGV